jgi:transposase
LVESTASGAVCPRCGQPSTAFHDGYERTVRDLPILGRPVYVHVLQRRFKGFSCGKPFSEPSAVVDWQQRHTRRYQPYLLSQWRGSSIQDVSRKPPIGYRVVERLLYRQAHHQFDIPKRLVPKRIGMEEFAKRKGHNYATIVVNLRTHQVFDVLDKRTKATVSNFLAARPERRRLKGATIDMRRECRDALKEQCPWTLIGIDRFQVVKGATTALHNVRKRVIRHASETAQSRLKRIRELLGKAPEDLRPAERLDLYSVMADFPALRLAHSLVHWLRRWYDRHDVQVACARLRAWRYRVKQANLEERNELAATIRRWRPWIVNFFRDRVTNGVTEGINTTIKLIKRVAYGLPNFAHLRARILMAFAYEATAPPEHKLWQRAIVFKPLEGLEIGLHLIPYRDLAAKDTCHGLRPFSVFAHAGV